MLSYIKSVIPQSVLEVKWPWGQEGVEELVEGLGKVDGQVDEVDNRKVEMEKGRKRILEETGADYKHEPREVDGFLDHGVEEAEKANRGDNASKWKDGSCERSADIQMQVYGHNSPSRTRSTSRSSSSEYR